MVVQPEAVVGMSDKSVIYMPLLDEGTDVWRPVEAVRTGNDYLVVQTMPEGEIGKFAPGSVVKCEPRAHLDGQHVLAAVEFLD